MSLTILIVDDEENFRHNIETFLTSKDYEAIGVSTLKEAKECIDKGTGDIILLDVKLPDGYGPDLLEETAHLPNRPPIILITAYGEIEMAVMAMKNGAHDFLQKPIQFERLEKSILRAGEMVAMRRELEHYRRSQHQHLDNILIGDSPAMNAVLDHATRAASASVSVLLTGLTGTGKEVFAQAIHQMGPRVDKPFIPINCGAIQPTMLESELFGHEAGAFTHAVKRKHGLMEIADHGILFLDEISSMPVDMQSKLLRAIEDKEFRRVGGNKAIRVDVQIIAASNRDLPTMIKDNKFREDLYYRLKVVDLHLPPLVERKQDIPKLVGMFIREFNPRLGLNITNLTARAMEALIAHNWPGNIRELRNAIERAMLFCDEEVIDLNHLPSDLSKMDD
jgi:DNA-binding NtrC family response regulator